MKAKSKGNTGEYTHIHTAKIKRSTKKWTRIKAREFCCCNRKNVLLLVVVMSAN